MDEKNELNDIILNKSDKSNSTKKILLTIATFAIILIIVVVIMNQFSGSDNNALPHPPENNQVVVEEVVAEPETEAVETTVPVVKPSIENTSELVDDDEAVVPDGKGETERIVEAVFEEPAIEEPVYTEKTNKPKASVKSAPKPIHKSSATQVLKPKKVYPSGKYDPKTKSVKQSAATGSYYIQVGSFAKYAPSRSFLNKIEKRGYTYTFHKVTRNGRTLNKVLVGPFKTQGAAREALPVIKRSVEPGAFLTKL